MLSLNGVAGFGGVAFDVMFYDVQSRWTIWVFTQPSCTCRISKTSEYQQTGTPAMSPLTYREKENNDEGGSGGRLKHSGKGVGY